ncbi:hypothetical protein KFU94_69525 [Chloroflexi bacterium TSY]|nr:hypothetical protein [Chloroflexi bacterium TSY]
MSLQSLAGTCPVTKQSGKVRTVHFRRACDHDFRYFTQQFAAAPAKSLLGPLLFTPPLANAVSKRVMLIALSLIAGFASFGNCGKTRNLMMNLSICSNEPIVANLSLNCF